MKNDGERLAALEVEMKNIDTQMMNLRQSIDALHGKFDTITQMITTNYVAKDTFEEYKKNKWMERIMTVLITSIITGLVAFFLGGRKI